MALSVHNWTVDQTREWLADNVDLPQYVDTFVTYQINGSLLPTLATNSRFMTDVLGIRDPIHRQKISLKAMDIVLFGAPKAERYHIWKETILLVLLLFTLACYWYAYRENKRSQKQLKRMMIDMESLSKAETALANMQKEMSASKEEDEQIERTKRNDLEKKIRREITQKCDLGADSEYTLEEQVSRLKEELTVVRTEWERAEQELSDRCWFAPPELQNWLQLTFETELRYFNAKKAAAHSQLSQAKEACEKLKKRRSNLIGSFVSAHGKNIDDVDTTILQAKSALVEVTNDLQERMNRWQQIERLCNCSIINNPGYNHLEMLMRGGSSLGSGSYAPSGQLLTFFDRLKIPTKPCDQKSVRIILVSRMNGSHHGEDEDDAGSVYAPSVVEKLVWSSVPMFIHPVHGSTGTGVSQVGPRVLVRRKKSTHSGVEPTSSSQTNGGIHPSNTQISFEAICGNGVRTVANGGDAYLHQIAHGFPHSKSSNAIVGMSVSVPRRSPSSTMLDQLKDVSESEALDEFPANSIEDDLQSLRRKVVGGGEEDVFGASFSSRPMSAVGLTRRVRMSNKSLSHDAGMEPIGSVAVAAATVGREALLQQSPGKSQSESALDARARGVPAPNGSPTATRGLSGTNTRSQASGDTCETLSAGDGEKPPTPEDVASQTDAKAVRRSKKSLFSKLAPNRHRKSSPPALKP
ncbi:unnamed protein product [Notodromas monacha]|uniref:SAM domain-containing protein n=1 Tax=Notodromas monacha TaxID=399045 RepID=A0A7R9BKK3_9CRUS|nr:unnamed protein product [Notodromas monacha]CAG0916414.1 unnamed protein product [Notodromas monacha]